jgi:hypothetical protein
MWTDATVAMARLTNRVDPVIPAAVRRAVEASVPTTVYAHVKIDETGAVDVIETQGVHVGLRDAVRDAVKKWTFAPTDRDKQQRCVETILPVVVPR